MRARLQEIKEKHGVYFIAELGQNHQGSLAIAKQMIDSLIGSGVAAVKTAKRDIDVCLTEEQKQMIYDNSNSFGHTYYEHRKALELSMSDFRELKYYAESKGFDFISSFTDLPSLEFLCNIDTKILKIASQRLADWELLKETAQKNKPIIISSGMSSIDDVDKVMEIFKYNQKYLLQCTASYPCAEENINLNVINTFRQRYITDGFGLSGHHTGIAPDIAAYCMGVDIIERHYTLRRDMKGTDHAASLELSGVKYIMKYIKEIRQSMGTNEKMVLNCELSAIKKLRK